MMQTLPFYDLNTTLKYFFLFFFIFGILFTYIVYSIGGSMSKFSTNMQDVSFKAIDVVGQIFLALAYIHILAILAIVLYAVQVLLSFVWLKYFKYAPLEWAWRCLTNKQLYPILIVN